MFLQPLVSLPDPFLTGGGLSRDPVCRPSRRQPEVHAPGDGHPLDGGYYDAGDNLKFNWPMAYTTVLLAWSGIAFPDGYAKAGQRGYLEGVVRWATDYFIKCHVSDHEFYAQVSADMLTLLSVAVL